MRQRRAGEFERETCVAHASLETRSSNRRTCEVPLGLSPLRLMLLFDAMNMSGDMFVLNGAAVGFVIDFHR